MAIAPHSVSKDESNGWRVRSLAPSCSLLTCPSGSVVLDCAAEIACTPGKRPCLVFAAENHASARCRGGGEEDEFEAGRGEGGAILRERCDNDDVDAHGLQWRYDDMLEEIAGAEAVLISTADGWLGTGTRNTHISQTHTHTHTHTSGSLPRALSLCVCVCHTDRKEAAMRLFLTI